LGKGQIESYNNAIHRFGAGNKQAVYNAWLTAWAGKYTADLWRESENDPLLKFLESRPRSKQFPGINASRNVIQSWFSTAADGPFDFRMLYKIQYKANKNMGVWTYQASDEDTYTMALATADGTLIKEYLSKQAGKVSALNSWFVASTIRLGV